MGYKSPELGHKITCTFRINNTNLLDNKGGRLKKILEDALTSDGFKILGWREHQFKPKGYSCIALLQESHADLHTYPEHRSLVFDMYSCRGENDVEKTFKYVSQALKNPQILFYSENQIPVTRRAALSLIH